MGEVKFKHYRIPQITFSYLKKTKGKPSLKTLLRYTRHVEDENPKFIPSPRGGATVASTVLDDGTEVSAVAVCSLQENFSYKEGRRRSLNRLNDVLYFLKEQ